MASSLSRVLYRTLLRTTQHIENRVPRAGIELIQKDILKDPVGAIGRDAIRSQFKNQQPDPVGAIGRDAIRSQFKNLQPTQQNLTVALGAIRHLRINVFPLLPEEMQYKKYDNGTVFYLKYYEQLLNTKGIIYSVHDVCMDRSVIPDGLVYGLYQPFYVCIIDNLITYVPQEFIVPTNEKIRSPWVERYFDEVNDRYVPKSAYASTSNSTTNKLGNTDANPALPESQSGPQQSIL